MRKMTAVGFEPTRIAPPELESGALDRSAKLSSAFLEITSVVCLERKDGLVFPNKLNVGSIFEEIVNQRANVA